MSDYKEDGFFDFMHEVIWPQITDYIDKHEDNEEFIKDFDNGSSALILAYGNGGIASWGTQDALYQRVGNIMFESLKNRYMNKKQLKNLCNGAIKRYEEYINGKEKV